MHVLFATAELTPLAAVGGLAAAAAGLAAELREQGHDVSIVLPDYGGVELAGERWFDLDVPAWAAPAVVRVGEHSAAGEVHLVAVPDMERSHPYLQPDGSGWSDNDIRFLAFSQAVVAVFRQVRADVLHLNDWHTAAALAAFAEGPPSVLSIHNLAYQGATDGSWLARLGPRAAAYEWYGGTNPLSGGIALADVVVAVSPTYAREICEPEFGCGLDALLRWRGDDLVGILNGIDTRVWDPSNDEHLAEQFTVSDLAGKAATRAALLGELGLPAGPEPLAVLVTRLVDQKGTDLLPGLVPFLEGMGLRMAVLGSGDAVVAAALHDAARRHPDRLVFVEGYDDGLSHRLFGGGDLLLMPSRFEPCGLSQMQAMRYGTLPVATDLGGLHDTIVDGDRHPATGTGWLASAPTAPALVDVLHRAAKGFGDETRRVAMQQRGMAVDWSWREPAMRYAEVYADVVARHGHRR
jgi:starch synthase